MSGLPGVSGAVGLVAGAPGGFGGISAGAVGLGLLAATVVAAVLLAADRAVGRLSEAPPCIGENPDVELEQDRTRDGSGDDRVERGARRGDRGSAG